MKMKLFFIGFSAMLILSPLAVNAEPSAKEDSCAFLKPDDLTKLLGGKPEAQFKKGACSWAVSGAKSRLVAAEYPHTGMQADMAYASSRKSAGKAGKVGDLKGIGDKAYVRIGPFGVILVIFKDGKLLQMHYRTEAAGTNKDIEDLIPVAKKAIAAL